ncbi:hypothetical protein IFM89_006267 [Coptis chinensis]|uniref:FAR1 domain-containing protein n=1 Tax=Coptis chinensis TaxID=261450 RepID=A0A835GXH5_9MAGN|nr:hypothetical protein IFM89_006267 [Coptis chinensis]
MEFESINMENDTMEFDMEGLEEEEDGIDIEHPVDDDDDVMYENLNSNNNSRELFYMPEGDTNLEPHVGMEFESEEAAKAFYNSYARRVGFSTRAHMSRRSKRNGAIIQRSFVCAREGFRVEREKNVGDGKVRRPRAVTRVGCKAMMALKVHSSGNWVVTSFEKEHNHELVPQDKVHRLRSHRHVSALKYVDEGAKTVDLYNVAMRGLQDASKMLSLAKQNGGKLPVANGSNQEHANTDEMHSNDGHRWVMGQHRSADDKDKKIDDLHSELDRANRKCEVYRANLLSILKDIEEQKLQLTVKVQNIKLGMKD